MGPGSFEGMWGNAGGGIVRLAPPGTGEEEKGVWVCGIAKIKLKKRKHERKPRRLILGRGPSRGAARSRGTPCAPPREVHRPRRKKK